MMPNLDPRMMKAAMKKMGIQQEEIEADEVIIKARGRDIIIKHPEVMKMKMMGRESFEITGEIEERAFSKEDVKTVAEQANVSEEDALAALEKSSGNLAEAIMSLKSE